MIYVAHCSKRGITYIALTTEKLLYMLLYLLEVFGKHKQDYRKRPRNTESAKYFTCNCSIEKYLSIAVLQNGILRKNQREFY